MAVCFGHGVTLGYRMRGEINEVECEQRSCQPYASEHAQITKDPLSPFGF